MQLVAPVSGGGVLVALVAEIEADIEIAMHPSEAALIEEYDDVRVTDFGMDSKVAEALLTTTFGAHFEATSYDDIESVRLTDVFAGLSRHQP